MKFKKEVITRRVILLGVFMIFIQLSFITTAGVGIKWDKESALINEGERTCLTYNVYNPWPEDSYVMIGLSSSSSDLGEILIDQTSEEKLIPANTPSSASIPVEFCFKAPRVYERDCWIGDIFICEQKCEEEQKIYEGEVSVKSIPSLHGNSGSGGSASAMSVSAPLRIRINCDAHSRDFSLIYVLLAIVALIVGIFILCKKYGKSKIERDKEKVKKLKEEIRNEARKKKE